MTAIAVAATELAAYEKTLAAATVDTVTFGRHCQTIRVSKDDSGSSPIYFTVDGTVPTVGGATTYRVRGVQFDSTELDVKVGGSTVVKLISAGTPTYSVEGSI